MKNQIVFRERKSGIEISALRHATIKYSSDGPGWNGLKLQVGSLRHFQADDLMVNGHFITFNPTDVEWQFEIRGESDWFTACMPPQTFWINPEGFPFSVRHNMNMSWAHAIIDGKYLDSVVGHHYELRQNIGIADDLLAYLMQSIVANLQARESSSAELDAELVRGFTLALAKKHGYPAAELSAKGGIASHQLKFLLAWLEENFCEPLTIDLMASQIALSAAHFSREFKRSTGHSPWGYVVQLRIDHARKLLGAGVTLSDTATKCGFSDQSHMSRLFKQRLGVSPSAFFEE